MLYYGTVKVSSDRNANIYQDPATGLFRYYIRENQRKGKHKWSEDFETFVDAAEHAQDRWLNDSGRDG